MRTFSLFLIATLIITGCTDDTLSSEEETSFPESKLKTNWPRTSLKVVTQNVGWLTDPGAGYEDHMEDMAEYLATYHNDADVINIQEAFTKPGNYDYSDFASYLSVHTNLNFSSDYTEAINYGIDQSGHGLWTFSKFPIISEYHEKFNSCNGGIGSCDSDCLADKGFISLTLDVGSGRRVQIINTHLDAGTCPGDFTVRASQISRLSEYISDYTNLSSPLITVGDFNVNGFGPLNSQNENYSYQFNYQWLKNQMNSWASFSNDFPSGNTTSYTTTPNIFPSKYLDYIFISNIHRQPYNYNNTTDFEIDQRPVIWDFTDHYTVTSNYVFEWSPINSNYANITSCQATGQYGGNGYICFHDGVNNDFKWYVNGASYGTGTQSQLFYCSGTPNIELRRVWNNSIADSHNSCSL